MKTTDGLFPPGVCFLPDARQPRDLPAAAAVDLISGPEEGGEGSWCLQLTLGLTSAVGTPARPASLSQAQGRLGWTGRQAAGLLRASRMLACAVAPQQSDRHADFCEFTEDRILLSRGGPWNLCWETLAQQKLIF